MTQTELKIQLDGRTLHGRRFGPPGEIEAVFIHGWLDNLESFGPLLPFLEDSVSGLAIDLTGHGASEPYPQDIHDVTVVDWVLDILGVCEQITQKPILLVGHSLGAGLCTMVAGLAPEQVSALVLLDGIVPLPADENSFCERFRNYVHARNKAAARGQRIYNNIESVIEARVKAGDIQRELAEKIVSRNVSLHKGGVLWSTDPRLKLPTVHRLTQGQIMSVIREIKCTVFLYRALNRQMEIDDTLFDTYANSIERIDIISVNTSHYVHADIPNQVAQKIKEILKKNEHTVV